MPIRFLKSKKSRVTAGFLVTMLALAVGAIAYWSAIGSGEGEYAKTKTASTAFEVTNVEGAELYPGSVATPKAKVKNLETVMSEHLKTLSAEIKSVSNSGTLAEAEAGSKCYLGWFEIKKVNGVVGTSNAVETNIAHEASLEVPVEVEMKEEATKNQNGCKNVHLTLKYTVS